MESTFRHTLISAALGSQRTQESEGTVPVTNPDEVRARRTIYLLHSQKAEKVTCACEKEQK